MNPGTLLVVGVIALMIPIGVVTIATRRKTLKWPEILLIGGVTILPVVSILAITGMITPMTTIIVLGMVVGHVLTYLDTD